MMLFAFFLVSEAFEPGFKPVSIAFESVCFLFCNENTRNVINQERRGESEAVRERGAFLFLCSLHTQQVWVELIKVFW